MHSPLFSVPFLTVGILAIGLNTCFPRSVAAEVLCVRAVSKIVGGQVSTSLVRVKRGSKCRTGEVRALSGPKGDIGPDGQLRIYGDASGGTKVVATSETLSDAMDTYADFIVNSGTTLTVPSGTVIRCSGNFTNNGTIVVQTGAPGGLAIGVTSTSIRTIDIPPHPGISARAAASGEEGTAANGQSGGHGGVGVSEYQAKLLRYPGPFAGGAGAGEFFEGGAGGGSLVILCAGSITNNGQIRADGGAGVGGQKFGGGGGGGVLILASQTSVVSSAGSSLLARGGNGCNSGGSSAPCGGGGGGIVHLIAPAVNTTSATVSVEQGKAGATSGPDIESDVRSGGHGGGASGGSGGRGGSIFVANTRPQAAFDGGAGKVIVSLADPTPLF